MALLNEASARPARLAGDGRADSPGFSAKFGTYSLLDLDSGKIIHFELVQVCRLHLVYFCSSVAHDSVTDAS